MVIKKKRDNKQNFLKRAITGFILGLFFYFSFFHFPPIFFSSVLLVVLALIAYFEWPRLFSLKNPKFWLLFPFYPSLGIITTILLNHNSEFRILIVFVGIIAYSFDFGAYAAGSSIGKHKLAPIISPRKTWEGVIGGFLFSFSAVYLITLYTGSQSSLFMKLFITFCITTLALIGDLFESSLKRTAGIKDTGNILPGHGGFLDRFDSLLLTMPIIYLFKEFFINFFF